MAVFFFNDTATTEIYTLSLHDALPIYDEEPAQLADDLEVLAVVLRRGVLRVDLHDPVEALRLLGQRVVVRVVEEDRKSTRLNSSHANISYAVFCLKKKNRHFPLPLLIH